MKETQQALTLDELKRVELDILRWFDAFCKEHGIKYFLTYGTLLGAVRHEGFIPWDDDIDVGLLREEYIKLCDAVKKYPDKRYKCYVHENNEKYLYPFMKVIDTETYLREEYIDCGVDLGVYIDVFPYDWETADANERNRYFKQYLRLEGLLDFAMSRKHGGTGLRKVLAVLMETSLRIVGKKTLTRQLIKLAQGVKNERELVSQLQYIYKPGREVDASVLRDLTVGKFEGYDFPIPAGYDMVLKKIYGNYMEFPPENKRVAHHDFVAFYKS